MISFNHLNTMRQALSSLASSKNPATCPKSHSPMVRLGFELSPAWPLKLVPEALWPVSPSVSPPTPEFQSILSR